MSPPIAVVATGFNVPEHARNKHFQSIGEQIAPVTRHIYLDAQHDFKAASENLYHAIRDLSPDTIVLSVDGDDWLTGPKVTTRVLREYEECGAWMTWGSYFNHDGRRRWHGNTSYDVPNRRECRQITWFSSHLKTFRAGLFQKISVNDLLSPLVSPDPNQQGAKGWITDCVDLAFMFPMLEMSAERGRFIKEHLYIYNLRNPLSVHNCPNARKDFQKAEGTRLRALRVYPRLTERPW